MELIFNSTEVKNGLKNRIEHLEGLIENCDNEYHMRNLADKKKHLIKVLNYIKEGQQYKVDTSELNNYGL